MAEQNLREMMIDDINDDDDDESQVVDNQPKIRWYLIDTEKNPCKVWDFTITLLIIYNLIVSPFIAVFPDVYMDIKETNIDGVKTFSYSRDPNSSAYGT